MSQTYPDSATLKPCPFCGSKPVTERTGFSLRAMYIYCINDNGCPRPKAIGETEEKAIENWNLRFDYAQCQQVPEGFVLVPRELTAENGAKSALIGEFSETFDYMDDDGDECQAEIPVSWTTIKAIHKKMVQLFALTDSSTDRALGRNWVEDATHENGNYECCCVECGNGFIGHKRRVLCKLCSNLLAVSPDTSPDRTDTRPLRGGEA